MAGTTFDLQSHSSYSDGELPPAQVVAAASAAGVRLLALTDHDTVDGVGEALQAAMHHGVTLVPAIEVSSLDPTGKDLHILGYGIDHTDPHLAKALRAFRADREQRGERMATALEQLGFKLADAEIRERRAANKPIGRPHLAQAVTGHPANASRLEQEGLTTPSEFLVAYLIEGAPAFRDRTIPTVAEAIDTIHRAGGLAIWAHPFWDLSDASLVVQTIARFQTLGLDGVEAFYVSHTREQTETAWEQCEALGLLSTGSSDFHGPSHQHFSRWLAFDLYGMEPRLGPIGS